MIKHQCKIIIISCFLLLLPVLLFSQFTDMINSSQCQFSQKTISITDHDSIKTFELTSNDLQKAGAQRGFELYFREPLLLDGVVKAISLKILNKSNTVIPKISILLKSPEGIPYRLEEMEVFSGETYVTWTVSHDFSPNYYSPDKAELAGFRIYTERKNLDNLIMQSVEYLTDEYAFNYSDYNDLEWTDAISLSVESTPDLTYPIIKVPNQMQEIRLPQAVDGDFEGLADIFGNPLGYGGEPGFFLVRNELVHSLFLTNPPKAIALFQSFGGRFWEIVPPNIFFQIIGYQYSCFFDNLFFYSKYNQDRGQNIPLLLAAQYSADPGLAMGKNLLFWDFPATMEPEDFLQVYRFYKERNIPLDNLIFHLKDSARLLQDHEYEFRNLNLEERLFRALLVRLDLIEKLPDHPMDVALSIPGSLQPIYSLDKAVANFYSGKPEANDLDILNSLSQIALSERLLYAKVLLLSPENSFTEGMKKILLPLLAPYTPEDLYQINIRQRVTPYSPNQIKNLISERMMKSNTPERVAADEYGYEDTYFNRYYFDINIQPCGFSVDPVELSLPDGFIPIEKINLVLEDCNTNFIITALMESEDGILWEIPLGKTGFQGIRSLDYSKQQTLASPKSRFTELRLYKLRENTMFEKLQYPNPVNIGKLLIETEGIQ